MPRSDVSLPMEICSITLKNFKTHGECHCDFRPGVNAICGENGAGKTSILEAIAWVLFDHRDYPLGELIRTGSKSTQVTVSFLSSLDGRVYEARRCSNRGYELHDPQLNLNLGLRKQEDVQAWMRQHLGVAPQTDLARLFAETIGIAQGTFTSDFLKRPVDRKKIFDPILKVEEYKQVYDQMRDLESYGKAQVATLAQQLASYEQQLADWADLQHQATVLEQSIAQDMEHIEQLSQSELQVQAQVAQLTTLAQQIQSQEGQVRQLEVQLAHEAEALQRLEAQCNSAHQAVQICLAHREAYHAYDAAQADLQTLSVQRRQQQTLQQQREKQRQSLSDREAKVAQYQGQLATFTQLRQDLAQWTALVPQQEHLEGQLKDLQERCQSFEAIKFQRQTLSTQFQQNQGQLAQLQVEITELEALQPQVQHLPQLEMERQNLQAQLSRLQAGQGFAQDLQSLTTQVQGQVDRHGQQVSKAQSTLKPMLGQHPELKGVGQVLEAGVMLNGQTLRSLQELLDPLTAPDGISLLSQQLQALTQAIEQGQSLQQQLAVLPTKRQQQANCHQTAQNLDQQRIVCDRQLEEGAMVQAQATQIEGELNALNNPKGNLQILQQQLQQEVQIQSQLTRLQAELVQQQQTLLQLEQEMTAFADLDQQFEVTQQRLQTHQADHGQYLRHREEANRFKELRTQLQEAQTASTEIQDRFQQAQTQLQHIQQTYQPEHLVNAQASLLHLQQQKAQLQGGLVPKQKQSQDLQKRLQVRQTLAEQQQRDRKLRVQKEATLQFIVDSRQIFNQSGPRITKYYLAEVSLEADKLFRELLNRDEVSLEWTEDYDIRVKERGHWRSFRSLSGGEQMCAALAVRLALLRVLADINIAFFDEPTTNMDQMRRRQLADAISNLKAFRQLIVISHDDTFEHATEHVIRLERRADS